MRNVVILAALGVSVSACAGGGGGLYNRNAPDEMKVTRAAPLVIPPDFALTPPAAGTPQAAAADSSTQALQAMFGGPAARSTSEVSTVGQAGGARAQPGIRSNAGDPNTDVVDKGSVTRDVVAAPEGDGREARAGTPK